MININVDNSITKSQIDQGNKLIDVMLENNSAYPLTFDVIFFSNPVEINNKEFYKLFVRLNLYDDKYILSKINSDFKILGDTSTAKFAICNSSGTNELKTLDDKDKIIFKPSTIVDKKGNIFSDFYCLKIPKDKLDVGEINTIKFQADIHGVNSYCSQKFYGCIFLNDLKKVEVSNISLNKYRIKQFNLVEGYFNYLHSGTLNESVDLVRTYFDIKDNSKNINNLFQEDYIIQISNFVDRLVNYQIDETTRSYIKLEEKMLSGEFSRSISSEFDVITDDTKKISDFYSFKKPNNTIKQLNSDFYEIKNNDKSYINFLSNKVEIDDIRGKNGIFINPNILGKIYFSDEITLNNFEFNILNCFDCNNDKKIDIKFSNTDSNNSLNLLCKIDFPILKLKSASLNYIRNYIHENQKNY